MTSTNNLNNDIHNIKKSIVKNIEDNKILCLHDNNKSKVFINNLSPGCRTCIEGKWACIFINRFCTRNCFFCPQNRLSTLERKPIMDDVFFDSSADFVDFLKKFNFKGVGFTGGEPLLAFDLLLNYISKIRKSIKNIYIWLYTNGDLITPKKLFLLKKAGLDEIRFNLSARQYDFSPIKIAQKIIEKVAIETPVIPEEINYLEDSIKKIKQLNIDYLNIHELLVTKYNVREFKKRRYTFKKNGGVIDSEIKSLKLIKYLIQQKLKICVNYCSTEYKHRFQWRGRNLRYSKYIKEEYESITPIGFIRQIIFKIPINIMKKYEKLSREKRVFWKYDRKYEELILLPSLINERVQTLFTGYKILVRYYQVYLRNITKQKKGNYKLIKINSHFSVIGKRFKECRQINVQNMQSLRTFMELFILKKNKDTILKAIMRKNNINDVPDYLKLLNSFLYFYKQFEELEYIGSDLK